MNNLPSWVSRVTTAWVAIGTFLIVLATQGVTIPEWLPDLFSQSFVDATLAVVGAVITYFQFVRQIFASKSNDVGVKILSAGQKRSFALNPFKLDVAA